MTYEERLAALEHMFPVGTTRVTQDVKDWLIGKGFLAAPYSFHQLSMRYDGSLFDHAFNTATALQVITRNSGMRWERPESPLIVGMFSELYRLDWYDDADTLRRTPETSAPVSRMFPRFGDGLTRAL